MSKLTAEFSMMVDLQKASDEEKRFDLSPNQEECSAIADRLGLLSIDFLNGDAQVGKLKHTQGYEIRGSLKARYEQACVVSLEPVHGTLDTKFEFLAMKQEDIDAIDSDEYHQYFNSDIEPMIEGQIDLGEVFVQIFALSVDPYPKAEGVSVEALAAKKRELESDLNPVERANPFAVLQSLKDKG